MSLTREQSRERTRRRRAAMTDVEREEERRKAQERMRRLRATMTPEEREVYNAKRRGAWVPRPRKYQAPAPPPIEPPPNIGLRLLWAKAHPNSAIRRKFPNTAALRRAS